MKLGIPTLIELETLDANAKLCNELGLDFIEINMNLPQYQASVLTAEYLNKIQKKYGVFFTFHIPEDIDIAHLNDKVRTVNHDIVVDTITLMKKVSSSRLNMHMSRGVHFTLPDEKIYLYENFRDQYLSHIEAFRLKMDNAIGDSDIIISIENTGIFNIDYLKQGVDCLLESKVFELTWDIGHDHSSGHLDKDFIEARADRVSHMHIHDAIGEKNHLQLYTGEMDIDRFVEIIRDKNISAVIETKTELVLRKSVSSLKEKLHKLDGAI